MITEQHDHGNAAPGYLPARRRDLLQSAPPRPSPTTRSLANDRPRGHQAAASTAARRPRDDRQQHDRRQRRHSRRRRSTVCASLVQRDDRQHDRRLQLLGHRQDGVRHALLRHNCVYGNAAYNYSGLADPTGTDGNISVDPGLASAALGNIHIQPGSPCVDAGDDTAVQAGLDRHGRPDPRSRGATWTSGPTSPTAPPGPAARVRHRARQPDGNDANDGSSWALAKRTVQAAIDAAAAAGGRGLGPGRDLRRADQPCGTMCTSTAASPAPRPSGRSELAAQATILDGNQGGSVVTAASRLRLSTHRRLHHPQRQRDRVHVDQPTAAGSTARTPPRRSPTTRSRATTPPTVAASTVAVPSSPIIVGNTITGNAAQRRRDLLRLLARRRSRNNGASPATAPTRCSGGGLLTTHPRPRSRITRSQSTRAYGGGIYCRIPGNDRPTHDRRQPRHRRAAYGDRSWRWLHLLRRRSSNYRRITRSRQHAPPPTAAGSTAYVDSSPTIAGNTITGNSALARTAGVDCDCLLRLLAEDRRTTPSPATAADYGGGYLCWTSANAPPHDHRNTITGNSATCDGGGIYCGDALRRRS